MKPSCIWQLSTFILFVLSSPNFASENHNPSGTWRWEYDMQGETRKDAIRINLSKDNKVVGDYFGRDNTIELKDGKMDGDDLSFNFDFDFDGMSIGLFFVGKMKKDDMEGTVTIKADGQEQEFPWNPKRSVKLEDVVGKWQFRIDTGNGNTLEPSMEIAKKGKETTVKYTARSGTELEVNDLKVEDNQLRFTVTGNFDGTDLTAKYSGRPYGDKISGKINYAFGDQTGEVEFAGKRETKKKTEKKS